jgi:predicted metal-binding membrane protein
MDAASTRDTPRSAFGLLSWRANLAIVVALFAVSLIAWQSTVEQALSMRGMAMGLGQVGWLAQGDMSAAAFLAMWVTMMSAMMLPTIAPIVLAHVAVMRRRGRGIQATLVFVAGYLFVWFAAGVAPLLAYRAVARLDGDAAGSGWLAVAAGAILILAGVYQFTRWKRACLDRCQSPLAFVATHDFGAGSLGTLRAGVVHGAYCLGCCWALTAVLLAVGLMNLVWMAAIFAVFVAEKSWRHGLIVAKIAGILLVALGAAVVAHPALLATLSLQRAAPLTDANTPRPRIEASFLSAHARRALTPAASLFAFVLGQGVPTRHGGLRAGVDREESVHGVLPIRLRSSFAAAVLKVTCRRSS